MNPFLIKILKIILIFLLMINCDEKKEIKISSIANENIVNKNDTIIDSEFNFEQVFYGKDIPIQIINNQRLFDVYYYGYDGKIHKGQIVSHYSVVNDLKNVFDNLFNDKFPIYSVIPVNAFEWNCPFVVSPSLYVANCVCYVFLYFGYQQLWSFLWIFYLSYFSLGSCFGFDFDYFRIFSQKLTCNDVFQLLIFISTC